MSGPNLVDLFNSMPHVLVSILAYSSLLDKLSIYGLIKRIKYNLHPHQVQAIKHIERFAEHGGCMIAHDMGLGKTYSIVCWLAVNERKKLPTLIICPKSVTNVWTNEIDDCSFLNNRLVLCTTLSHSTEISDSSIVITNYSCFQTKSAEFKNMLQSTKWGTIVCDEAHHLRNQNITTTNVKRLIRNNMILLTATPYHNNVFEERISYRNLFSTGNPYTGPLEDRIDRVLKRDLKIKLSDIQDHFVELNELELEVYNIYHDAGRQMTLQVNKMYRPEKQAIMSKYKSCILPIYTRLQQASINVILCKDAITYEDADDVQLTKDADDRKLNDIVYKIINDASNYQSSKFKKMLELYMKIPMYDKVIIVSGYTSVLTLATEYICKNVGDVEFLSFTGKTQNRDGILKSFRNNPKIKILFLSANAGSEGIDLTAANHMIILDLDWNPQNLIQLQNRICRLNQTKPTFVHKILSNTPIEKYKNSVRVYKHDCAESRLAGVKRNRDKIKQPKRSAVFPMDWHKLSTLK